MRSTWINWLLRRTTADSSNTPALAPGNQFYAVGDIHGRLDLLQALLVQLEPACPIVFVGDYIDRGAQSAQVLRYLHALSLSPDRKVICLMGNHEEMLLQFLETPAYTNRLWLRNGGLQTLASFGVTGVDETIADEDAPTVADALRAAMGEDLILWLQSLPLTWSSGNVTAVHAALDPNRPLEHQHKQTCLWGHRQFGRSSRDDGQWVIHGHTIQTSPRVASGVISIDTGAFMTGRLTAAEVSPSGVRFVSTGQ